MIRSLPLPSIELNREEFVWDVKPILKITAKHNGISSTGRSIKDKSFLKNIIRAEMEGAANRWDIIFK